MVSRWYARVYCSGCSAWSAWVRQVKGETVEGDKGRQTMGLMVCAGKISQGSTKKKTIPRRWMIESIVGSSDGTLGRGQYIRQQRPCFVLAGGRRGSRDISARELLWIVDKKRMRGRKKGVPTWRPGEPWVPGGGRVVQLASALFPSWSWYFLGLSLAGV